MNSVVLHRAAWIMPVASPIIDDGAVVTEGTTIACVGPFAELSDRFPSATVHDYGNCVLLPALVNAHIHLELSHIPIPCLRPEVTGFTDWIETLLTLRGQKDAMGLEAEKAARDIMQLQHRLGVVALGDIGNTDLGARLREEFPGTILHFNECLGRSAKTRRAIVNRVATAAPDIFFTAHAPYSTHPELIRHLKKRAAANHHPFPIHVAEPPSEKELLCNGHGELHDFLRARDFIDDAYRPPASIDKPGSIQYLQDLGVLDKQTICVHCIHVSQEEIHLLAETGTKVCLCLGSNRYLRVGRPPVSKFLERGILPALGTDSVASNPKLSLWREMSLLHACNPEINPEDIVAMATLGGATALGIEDQYGSLVPGKSASFLAVQFQREINDETELLCQLVSNEDIQPVWVKQL